MPNFDRFYNAELVDLWTSIDHGVNMLQASGIYRGTFGLVSNDNDFDDGDGYGLMMIMILEDNYSCKT